MQYLTEYIKFKILPYSINPRKKEDSLLLIFALILLSYKIVNIIKDRKNDKSIMDSR